MKTKISVKTDPAKNGGVFFCPPAGETRKADRVRTFLLEDGSVPRFLAEAADPEAL